MTRLSKWTPIEVHWHDALGGGEHWDPVDQLPSEPATIRTVGLLARESSSVLVLVLSHDKHAERFADHVLIPKACVISCVELVQRA